MALSNMAVYNEWLRTATIETVAQMIDKFNGASAGAIVLSTDGFAGDYMNESMWASLHSTQRRVDRYAANGAQSNTAMAELDRASVKVAGGFGPILLEPSQMTWMESNPDEAVAAISLNLAEAILKDQLNTVIASLVAATENVAALTNDVSGSANITHAGLNGSHAKFGDMSGAIVCDVMRGQTYHDLIGQNVTNAERLFEANGVTITNILGKATVVTDAPSLYEAGTPNKAKVLSLVPNAGTVSDGGDLVTNLETSNGKDRIEMTFQADYAFGVGIKGYTWDTTNGGKSPTDAELATGSNWDKIATDDKHTAGTIAVGDADA